MADAPHDYTRPPSSEKKTAGLIFEVLYPIFGGAIAAVVYGCWFRTVPLPTTTSEIFAAVINVSAISVGFLATVKSILVSMRDRPALENFVKSGYYKRTIKYLVSAILLSFMVAILTAVFLFLNWKPAATTLATITASTAPTTNQPPTLPAPPDLSQWILFDIWLSISIAATLACFRAIWIFIALTKEN
jgi:hypothetical protein